MPNEMRQSGYRERAEDLIYFVNFLNVAGYDFDEIPSDVRAIYYSDFVYLRLFKEGARRFASEELPLHPLTERDILDGLVAIGAKSHSEVFRNYFVGQDSIDPDRVDQEFAELAKTEDVELLADRLMLTTKQIEWKSEDAVGAEIARLSLDRRLSASKEK